MLDLIETVPVASGVAGQIVPTCPADPTQPNSDPINEGSLSAVRQQIVTLRRGNPLLKTPFQEKSKPLISSLLDRMASIRKILGSELLTSEEVTSLAAKAKNIPTLSVEAWDGFLQKLELAQRAFKKKMVSEKEY